MERESVKMDLKTILSDPEVTSPRQKNGWKHVFQIVGTGGAGNVC